MQCDLEETVEKVPQNHPYIAVLLGDSSLQIFIVAERIVLCECEVFSDAVTALVATYFTFNIWVPQAALPYSAFHATFCIEA